jgi:chromosome segregation ATPase
VSTSCGRCGCAPESTNLTTQLKKRVVDLKAKLEEAENEIKRLLKTVKVVEVAVPNEDDALLKAEIAKLKRENDELKQKVTTITNISLKWEEEAKQQKEAATIAKQQVDALNEKLKLTEERYKREIDDLKNKLKEAERERNEANKAAKDLKD